VLVVKLLLWPQGDESRARQLGEVRIINDATGDETHGNYRVELLHAGKFWGKPGNWKSGRVLGWMRELSPYHLLLAALEATIGRALDGRPAEPVTTTRPVSSSGMSICKGPHGCGATIEWVTTSRGRKMPVDVEPINVVLDPGGPLKVVIQDGNGIARVSGAILVHKGEGIVARQSHFASCPNAGEFRRGR